MILYLDSSAILSIYLRESGRHEIVPPLIEEASFTFCLPLAWVEVKAGLARARYRESPSRIRPGAYLNALTLLGEDWQRYGQVPLTAGLITQAGRLAETHRLRAYDATHLAAALSVKVSVTDSVQISTWDKELAAAAEAEGLSLAHEVTN